MAYTNKNYKSGAELKRDWLKGVDVGVYQPGGLFPLQPGIIGLEGPHYPAPHSWYASGYHEDGMLIYLDLPGCKEENLRRAKLNLKNPSEANP
jgi:hypothetical protein